MNQKPAISLVAVPGKKARTIEFAKEIERQGFSGIYCPSMGDAMGLCQALAHTTSTITFGTAIQPIYLRHAVDLATHAGTIHELSGGRFRLGVGVSHAPANVRLGVDSSRPLSDIREYVAAIKSATRQAGELPPIITATLRDKMLDLSIEIADGAIWANASRSYIKNHSIPRIPEDKKTSGFFVGNMVPTVIDENRDAARAIHRRTLTGYVMLPNYRNYWKAAGYEEEMLAIEAALEEGNREALPSLMSDRWIDDCTLSGSVGEVREGIEAWFDAGVTTPIMVMSSTKGGQFAAIEELFEAFK